VTVVNPTVEGPPSNFVSRLRCWEWGGLALDGRAPDVAVLAGSMSTMNRNSGPRAVLSLPNASLQCAFTRLPCQTDISSSFPMRNMLNGSCAFSLVRFPTNESSMYASKEAHCTLPPLPPFTNSGFDQIRWDLKSFRNLQLTGG
jgi:hypothetical protein